MYKVRYKTVLCLYLYVKYDHEQSRFTGIVIKGFEPAEFFFHAMGGREGLIDTVVKPPIRDIFRETCQEQEDLHVEYDGTVRNVKMETLFSLITEIT